MLMSKSIIEKILNIDSLQKMYVALSKDIFSKKDIFLEKCFSDLRIGNQRKQQGAYSFRNAGGIKNGITIPRFNDFNQKRYGLWQNAVNCILLSYHSSNQGFFKMFHSQNKEGYEIGGFQT